MLLRIKNLDVFYDGLQALSSISLEVQDREFVSILGPNGAGKSTLLACLAGMLKPRSGEIIFEDRPVQGLPAHRMASLGMALVPEEGWLYPQMTAEENVLMGAFPKESRKTADSQLEFVYELFPRLGERRRQLAETMSGGERQMVAVARGLMSRPRLLMLDEPSLGLAPLVIKDIFESLKRINSEQKTTILLTEQNVFNALKLSARGYVLENGTMAMEGSGEELLASDHIKRNYLGL